MKICIPIRATSQKEVIKMLHEASKQADLAEIWLDHIKDLDLRKLLANTPLKVVCVCKRPVNKGKFKGSSEDLSKILLESIKFGADYVDIPLDMPEKLNKKIVQEAKKRRCKVIISHHNFKKTPDYDKMIKIVEKMIKKGANLHAGACVVKLATTATALQDTIDIISLGSYARALKTPHILIAMGHKGILSRILTPTLGGEMMFATLGKKGQTATGQLTATELRKAWSLLKLK